MQTISNAPLISYETWMSALASSACIGFTSLVPWLFNMTFFERHKQKQGKNQRDEDGRMKFLLSFAVGAILGDIFFHLIPESLHSYLVELNVSQQIAHRKVGLSILAGIFMFIIVEMILEKWSHSSADKTDETPTKIIDIHQKDSRKNMVEQIPIFANNDLKNETCGLPVINESFAKEIIENNNSDWTDLNDDIDVIKELNNNISFETEVNNNNHKVSVFVDKNRLPRQNAITESETYTATTKDGQDTASRAIDVAGYLSLIANGFDNFTHGLAIGASFLVGTKVGLLTTFVIFIHEIPHEICDYAILVNSGFSRWEAVKAQSSVSLFGILGTATALYVKSVQTLTAKTVWILPFSAGGFLYIALVNLLPEILDQRANGKDSLGQAVCVILGIIFMALVGVL